MDERELIASATATRTPVPVRLLAVPATVGLLVLGIWFFGAVLAPSYWTSIGFSVGWFIALSVLLGKATKGRRDLKLVVRATFWTASAVSLAAFWWTSVRERTVHERVVVGVAASQLAAEPTAEPAARPARPRNVELLRARVTSLAHGAHGRAAVVRLSTGARKLTLTDFDIDPGPKVEVRLVAGGDAAGGDFKRLGGLKGTRGNQQYAIERGIDLGRYRTVVFWCVPFTQALAQAKLTAA